MDNASVYVQPVGSQYGRRLQEVPRLERCSSDPPGSEPLFAVEELLRSITSSN
jgi:hypothetical protein